MSTMFRLTLSLLLALASPALLFSQATYTAQLTGTVTDGYPPSFGVWVGLAFAALVGQDLPAFEKDWFAYLLRLQSDGTLMKD